VWSPCIEAAARGEFNPLKHHHYTTLHDQHNDQHYDKHEQLVTAAAAERRVGSLLIDRDENSLIFGWKAAILAYWHSA